MQQYNVTGMSCAACQARVEKAVNAVPGVESCSVSLLTNSMGVTGSASSSDIIKAVEDAGYGASVKGKEKTTSMENADDSLEDKESPKIAKRLIASVILLVPLMYVSMGHMMWGWPLPEFLQGNHIAMGIYQLILAGLVMVFNQRFFISGFKGLIHRAPNMDTLVAMGSTASFVYSVYSLFAMTIAANVGNHEEVMKYMDEFYFESAATILTLITVGKLLEAKSKGRTTDALKNLMRLAPKTANLIKNGETVVVPIETVKIGDRFAVKPGESIPVDGVVIEGNSAIDESALSGESIPVDKDPGDSVSAATVNQSGYIVCEATRVGEDTTLSQIIQMVSDAAATKAPIAKIADKVSGVFVPAVIGIAVVTFIIWIITGESVGFSLARAISVLVISCPCALGLATPVAIMVGNGVGAKNGILFKTAVSLEATGKINIVALDKTGTITKGEPQVTDIVAVKGVSEKELLKLAYLLEKKSEHPLARAIVSKVKESNLEISDEVTGFEAKPGNGLSGVYGGEKLLGGNADFLKKEIAIAGDEGNKIFEKSEELANQGKTPLFFSKGGELLGLIAVADVIKEDSAKAIGELKAMGIHVVMLTGDNEKTANAIGTLAGVDEVIAGVRPDGKEEIVRLFQKYGKVAMVGDGINDAPALTRADMGIAIGAGCDVAIDAADIVLMKSSLMDVVGAIRLSQKTLKNIHENLFWAFFYNVIGIPLAAGMWIPIFGWTLNPMFGAAAMSLSSFCVVSNALRLNLFKPYKKTNKVIKNSVGQAPLLVEEIKTLKEDKKMKVSVEGMMCAHCEAHVKEAISAIEGVTEVVADHNQNLVTITTTQDISEDSIKAAVEKAGYNYKGIIE